MSVAEDGRPLDRNDLMTDGQWVFETPDGERFMPEAEYLAWEMNDLARILHNTMVYRGHAADYAPAGAFHPQGILARLAMSESSEKSFGQIVDWHPAIDLVRWSVQLELLEERGVLSSRLDDDRLLANGAGSALGSRNPHVRRYSLPGPLVGIREVVDAARQQEEAARAAKQEAKRQKSGNGLLGNFLAFK